MLYSPSHLPPLKKYELHVLRDVILEHIKPEFVILFGSYARGDWVADKYMEDYRTYEYKSDYDILIIVKNEKLRDNYGIWNELTTKINQTVIKTPVSIIVDTIDFVNKKINEHNYFYNDIRKEGYVLYDSNNYKLNEPGILNLSELKEIAKKDYEFWLGRYRSFIKDYNHNIDDTELNNAAFHLHQATEALYVAALLVITGYKPKTHDLEKMEKMLIEYDTSFINSFDRTTPENNDRFKLLQRAYVDARYRMDYVISLEDLKLLHQNVLSLEKLVVSICDKKLEN